MAVSSRYLKWWSQLNGLDVQVVWFIIGDGIWMPCGVILNVYIKMQHESEVSGMGWL